MSSSSGCELELVTPSVTVTVTFKFRLLHSTSMLGALVHSAWTPAVRIHLKWDHISRVITRPTVRSKSFLLASSQLRYPPAPPDRSVFEDLSKEYTTPTYNSPAYLTQPTSEQTLLRLVKEGKHDLANKVRHELSELGINIQPNSVYEAAVEDILKNRALSSTSALQNWLQLLPDAEKPNADAFIKIRKLLLASPKNNLPFIMQFGTMCALKGYTHILQNDILPVISLHCSPNIYGVFVESLQMEAKTHESKVASVFRPNEAHSSGGSAVFEDASDEYDLVHSESKSPSPSVLSLIQETLPALLPQPLSTDLLVFEDGSNPEYTLFRESSPYKPGSLIDTLHSLIHDEQYEKALGIFKEIQDLDIPIRNHWLYLKAAKNVIRSSDRSAPLSPEQLETFGSLLMLIPPKNRVNYHITFTSMWELIIHAPIVDVALIERFYYIMASRGYAPNIVDDGLPFIMRCFPADNCISFVSKFELSHQTFWMNFKPDLAPRKVQRLRTLVRGAAIMSLLVSRRWELALELLPSKENPYRLEKPVYDALLERLQSALGTQHRYKLEEPPCEVLLSRLRLINQADSVKRGLDKIVSEVIGLSKNPATVLQWSSPDYYPSTAVDMTRTFNTTFPPSHCSLSPKLLHAISSTSKIYFPHTKELVHLMEKCFDSGHTETFVELRDIVFNTNSYNIAAFILAEMVFYGQQGWHDFVIQTFAEHFFLTGVPHNEVLAVCERTQDAYNQSVGGQRSPARFPSRRIPFFGKMWPTQAAHCSLVWHALVKLAPDSATIHHLYAELVRVARNGSNVVRLPSMVHKWSKPTKTRSYVSAASFTPFIRPLMAAFGADRGLTILSDMMELGLKPGVYHYTELTNHYASVGDEVRAFKVLEQMEQMENREITSNTSLPSPDIVVYTSLMSGFIASNNLKAAMEVRHRLFSRHTYASGRNAALDNVLHKLEYLSDAYVPPVLPKE